jgi:large repetitive protein
MKTKLQLLCFAIFVCCPLLFTSKGYSQINYSQNFENGTSEWAEGDFIYIYPDYACTGSSLVGYTYVYGGVPQPVSSVSGSVGTSNGQQATLSYSYKVSDYMTYEGIPNDPDWGNIVVEYATSSGGPWINLETITPANHTVSSICAVRTVNFTPPAGSNVYLRVTATAHYEGTEEVAMELAVAFDNITVTQTASPATTDWANLQSPSTMAILTGGSGTVYAQVFESGLTEVPGAGAGITAWIGISPEGSNTNPNTWTTWIPATFNAAATVVNNDEYMATIGAGLTPGTYYYASRFELTEGPYTYGGYASGGGGFWNGTTNVSGVLTVTCATAAPVASAAQTFCDGSTIGDLEADGDVIKWYSAATGGAPLSGMLLLVDNTTYYATITPVGGCESVARTAVVVDVIAPTPAPVADATQQFCQGATVGDLEADGDLIKWYSAAAGGTPLAGTALLGDNTYYASVTPTGGCESVARTAVAVDVVYTLAPSADTSQQHCQGSTVADLEADANGDVIQWYSASTGGSALAATTPLADTTTYYASVTPAAGGCESYIRIGVAVQLTTIAPPTGDQTQEIEAATANDATLEDIEITATGTVKWYATAENAEDGENALPAGTVITSGTYYATQTIGGCESTGYAVTVDVTLGNGEFSPASFKYHPNPVSDILSLTYDKNISTVEVYTIIGQKVISTTIDQSSGQINMSHLSTGTYIVKVASDTAIKTIKIVKQ